MQAGCGRSLHMHIQGSVPARVASSTDCHTSRIKLCVVWCDVTCPTKSTFHACLPVAACYLSGCDGWRVPLEMLLLALSQQAAGRMLGAFVILGRVLHCLVQGMHGTCGTQTFTWWLEGTFFCRVAARSPPSMPGDALSKLRVEDGCVAAHIGMRHTDGLHWSTRQQGLFEDSFSPSLFI